MRISPDRLIAESEATGFQPEFLEKTFHLLALLAALSLFVFDVPKGGYRHIEVTQRLTAVDFAEQMRWLVDEAYPDAETIRVVLDNLNIHKLGSLYEAYEPSEARRIARRLELHHTPKNGSWLNPILSLPKRWRR